MEDLSVTDSVHDFSAVRSAMQRYMDQDILAGVSYAVLRGRDVLDVHCTGWADKEAEIPLRTDHIVRAMSKYKAGHVLRRASVMGRRQTGDRRSDRKVHPAIEQSTGAQARRDPPR